MKRNPSPEPSMPSITLKDVPEDLLLRLRSAAARERRSLTQEAIVLLEGGLADRETAEARSQRQVAAWRELAGAWTSDQTLDEEIEDLYRARSPGRELEL